MSNSTALYASLQSRVMHTLAYFALKTRRPFPCYAGWVLRNYISLRTASRLHQSKSKSRLRHHARCYELGGSCCSLWSWLGFNMLLKVNCMCLHCTFRVPELWRISNWPTISKNGLRLNCSVSDCAILISQLWAPSDKETNLDSASKPKLCNCELGWELNANIAWNRGGGGGGGGWRSIATLYPDLSNLGLNWLPDKFKAEKHSELSWADLPLSFTVGLSQT